MKTHPASLERGQQPAPPSRLRNAAIAALLAGVALVLYAGIILRLS